MCTEEQLTQLAIAPADERAAARARARWNAIAKPIGALGALEDAVVAMAALTGSTEVDIARRCVAVLCADNGVVDAGVTQCGAEVTATVARQMAQGSSSVCVMCVQADIDCIAVDMGMRTQLDPPGLRVRRVAAGTADITRGPAMSRSQALEGIAHGIELAGELAHEGYGLIAAGEMGIGNTTTATAMACAFTGMDPAALTGRGAGLSDAGLARKVAAIRRALAVNAPDPADPVDVLAKLGGFDIAGMCGLFLGGAHYRVPVIIDGFTSSVAAWCACQLRPECKLALLASHVSSEPAARMAMEHLGLRPPIDASMHLGEGAGAACLIPLLDMALALYRHGATFDGYGMQAYEVNPQ